MIYQFRSGARVSGVKAQDVGETLEALRENDGRLDTETVLREAKKKRSRIHNAFEWDDKVASNEYRLIQARQLIRSLVVTLEEGDEPAFVHVKIDRDNYYQSTSVAARNVDEWEVVRNNAMRRLQGASEGLDDLDRISERVKHTKAGGVRKVRDTVSRAAEQLSEM